jgi:FAD/FMN-containing dehydrogenase
MTAPTAERVDQTLSLTGVRIPGFRGEVIAAGHADYGNARAVWNGTIDRRPRVIARCTGAADAAAAVRFARERDLAIAVRGGGHNVGGTSVCDDGVVIDLSAMRAVSIDPETRTAEVQGGALWGDVDHETQAHGLATTGGIVGHTGVGGLSLGGGIGWLMRKHGLTIDNLVHAEVVTAEGEVIRASSTEHPDLFWALRGGGGNFGVVTSFRFRLHPVGPTVTAGPIFWGAEDTADVLRFYRDFVAEAPGELGNVIRLGTIPPLPVIDEELHYRPAIAVASCYAGPIDDGEHAVQPLREFGKPLVDLVGPTLYVDHQRGLDDTVPHGWHYYWKATDLTAISDEVIDIVAEHAYRATSPRSYAAMFHLGGAVASIPRDATAYPGRDVEHNIIIDAAWLPEQADSAAAAETAWAREFLHALGPHRSGVYVNFLDADDDIRVREAYRGETYQRLAEVKATYDPDNVFHNNKNIQPTSPADRFFGSMRP